MLNIRKMSKNQLLDAYRELCQDVDDNSYMIAVYDDPERLEGDLFDDKDYKEWKRSSRADEKAMGSIAAEIRRRYPGVDLEELMNMPCKSLTADQLAFLNGPDEGAPIASGLPYCDGGGNL